VCVCVCVCVRERERERVCVCVCVGERETCLGERVLVPRACRKLIAMISQHGPCGAEREFFIDNLLVRIHFVIVMIRWTGLAPWKFEFPFPGSLTSTFLTTCI